MANSLDGFIQASIFGSHKVAGVSELIALAIKAARSTRVSTITDIYNHIIKQAGKKASDCIADAILGKPNVG